VGWVFGSATYLIIWWLVIFAVLPFGVRPSPEDDPGHAAGAPAHPHLLVKFAVTTVIATAIWFLADWAVNAGLLDFRGS
jgi:predicted secreted protein